MLQNFLKILKIGAHELPGLKLLWQLRVLYQIGFIWAWVVVTAMFLEMFGIQNLWYLFLADAWLILIGSGLAHFLYLRFANRHFIMGCVLGTLACVAVAGVFQAHVWVFFIGLILAKDLFYSQLNIALFRKTESFLAPSQAQKIMPILDSAVTIGTIVASLAFLGLIGLIGLKNLILLWALPLVGIGYLIFVQPLSSSLTPAHYEANGLSEAKKLIGQTPFLRYLAGLVILQSALYTIIDFEFLKYIKSKAKPTEINFEASWLQNNLFSQTQELTQSAVSWVNQGTEQISAQYFVQTTIGIELGVLALIFGVIGLIVQLFLASKVLKRLGVVYSILLYFAGMLSMVATFIAGGVNMKFVRGYQHGFEAIFQSAYHLTFYSLWPKRREAVRYFLEGFIRPGGMIIGVGLMVLTHRLGGDLNGYLMLGILSLMLGLILVVRHAYTRLSHQNLLTKQELVSQIHAVEVLGQRGHHQAAELLSQSLLSGEKHQLIREKLVETATQVNDPSVVHTFIKLLSRKHEDLEIKIKILESCLEIKSLRSYWKQHAFSQHHFLEVLQGLFRTTKNAYLKKLVIMNIFHHLPQEQVVPFFLQTLKTTDQDLKSVCLRSAGEVFADPELVYYIQDYLQHKSPKVRSYAIITLAPFMSESELKKTIDPMLGHQDHQEVVAAVYTIGEIRSSAYEVDLLALVDHAEENVAHQALVALAKLGNQHCLPHLVEIIFGEDEVQAKRVYRMLKRAPEIADWLQREIQAGVADRVLLILTRENITHRKQYQKLAPQTRQYLQRLYRLAGRFDEMVWVTQ